MHLNPGSWSIMMVNHSLSTFVPSKLQDFPKEKLVDLPDIGHIIEDSLAALAEGPVGK